MLKTLAVFLCLALAACDTDPSPDIEAGTKAYLSGDLGLARQLLEPLAKRGNAQASARLALVESETAPDRAIDLAQPAIEQDLPIGQYLAAYFEFKGIGRPVSLENALPQLKPLAACGMPAALSASAVLHKRLENRSLYTEAEIADLTEAANADFAPAHFNLAMHLAEGKRDDYVSHVLIRLFLAASWNQENAVRALNELKKNGLPRLTVEVAKNDAEALKGSLVWRDPFKCTSTLSD